MIISFDYFFRRGSGKVTQAPKGWPFSCCGASYSQNKSTKNIKVMSNRKGIRVFNDIVSKEYEDDNIKICHVYTEGGNFTINLAKKHK